MNSRFLSKIRVILWKNWLIRKRHWIWSICEALIPVLLFAVVAYGRAQVKGFGKEFRNEPFYTEYDSTHQVLGNLNHDSQFLYAPNNRFIEDLFDIVREKLDLASDKVLGFSTEDELLKYYRQNSDKHATFAMVFSNIPPKDVPKQLKYNIRIYEKDLYWPLDTLFESEKSYYPNRGSHLYVQRGFMALQMAIDESYLEMATKKKNFIAGVTIQEFPYPPHVEDLGINEIFQYFLPLITLFSFQFLCPVVLKRVVEEKATGIKELMKIMGLRQWMLWIGWFLHAIMVNVVSIIVIVILLKVKMGSDYPVVEYSDGTILFAFLLLYCIACIWFCFTISTFFNNPNIALVVGLILWLLTYFVPQNYVLDLNKASSFHWALKLLFGLFPNVALTMGYSVVSQYETREIGSQWWNILDSPSEGTYDITLFNVFMILITQIVLYVCLTFYIDSVFPGKYGIGKRWYFPFATIYRKISQKICQTVSPDFTDEIFEDSKYFEEEDPSKIPGIEIRKLHKKYGIKDVLKGVNLKLYDGQIFVLLGHNGAGKTTLMSIMTGMISATSGDIFIENKDVKENMDLIYDSIGICPQHNMFFTDLTVKEHLIFFARLKGIPYNEASRKAQVLLEQIHLSNHKNVFPAKLSGGMKRKLNLAIALIGDPQVLILDEPTSGMDHESRREVWDILLEMRRSKTILVSTHFMEEADSIGDRIAIMDHGNLICRGTPLFLRNAFDAGYNLILTYKPTTVTNFAKLLLDLQHEVEFVLPGSKISHSNQQSITFSLPNEAKSSYCDLLKKFENGEFGITKDVEITDISVKNTTMEDVFLRAGYKDAKQELDEDQNPEKISTQTSHMTEEIHENSWFVKFWYLIRHKRFIIFKKKLKLHILLLLLALPVVILTLYLGTSNPSYDSSNEMKLRMDLSTYKDSSIFYSADQNDPKIAKLSEIYKGLVMKQKGKLELVKDVSDTLIEKGKENILFYRQHLVFAAQFNRTEEGGIVVNAMYSNVAHHAAPISYNLIINTILQAEMNDGYSIVTGNKPLPPASSKLQREQSVFKTALLWIFLFPLGPLFLVAVFVVFPHLDNVSYVKKLMYMCGINPFMYWLAVFLFDILIYVLQLVIIIIVISLFNVTNTNVFGGPEEIQTIFLLCFVYGLAAIPFSYFFSFMKTTSSALSSFIMVGLGSGILLTTIVSVMEESQDAFWMYVGDTVWWLSSFFPQFNLTYGLVQFCKQAVWNFNWNIMSKERRIAKCKSEPNPCCGDDIESCNTFKSYTDGPNSVLLEVFKMVVLCFLYYFILCALEKYAKRIKSKYYNSGNARLMPEKYETDGQKQAFLHVDGIKKLYSSFPFTKSHEVLKDLQFDINLGECYGLLGANGAGKSTTFRLLAGEECANTGTIRLKKDEAELFYNTDEYQREIGYCPQFDALNGEMTGKQMLMFFACLRGVDESKVDQYIDELGLNEFADVPTKEYSGGNKRKLNFGLSIIGFPRLVLLDEPTTGVDPSSRRKLWQIINTAKKLAAENKKNCALVLTSHSMDECEVLCDRLAILKDGNIKAKGTIPEIKKQFETGYTITIKLKPTYVINDVDETDSQTAMLQVLDPIKEIKRKLDPQMDNGDYNLKKQYPKIIENMKLIDEHQGILCYRVDGSSNQRWSNIFKFMETLKSEHEGIIADYSVSNTSLEEVFLTIARDNEENIKGKNRFLNV